MEENMLDFEIKMSYDSIKKELKISDEKDYMYYKLSYLRLSGQRLSLPLFL